MPKPIRWVRLIKAVLRQAKSRDQKPSFNIILPRWTSSAQPERSKIRGSVSGRQERCVREAAWKLTKKILKLKEKDKSTFFSPSEKYYLLSPSKIEPEEREFVVYPGASIHMISRKDLNSAELKIVRTSKSPTTVITANGEVQTYEETLVYVKELEKFLTLKITEDTSAVIMLGKLCKDHGYAYEWTNDRTSCLIKKRCSHTM